MTSNKIVHVHLKHTDSAQKDYYFGSITAIYTKLTEEQLGIKLTSLANMLPRRKEYQNSKVIIRISSIIRVPINKAKRQT